MAIKAKKLRREGFVTGNIFGKEIQGSIPVQMLKTDLDKVLKTSNKGSQILLDVDGIVRNVLIKEIDFNPLKNQVEEIDFQALVSGEKVHSVAEVTLTGHEKAVSGVLQLLLEEIDYRALPSHLIEKVTIDVGSLRVGDSLRVKDLDIAKDQNIELLTDPEALVVTLSEVHGQPEEDSQETAGEA